MRFSCCIIFIAIVTVSCDKSRIYEDTEDFNNAYWLADSVKSFPFNIPNANAEYNILFNIRNGIDYPHSNIYVHYAISDSTDNILEEELRNFQLFHPKTGYPFGNGSGHIYEHQFNLLMGYKFPYAGQYKIQFKQYMRYDSLPQLYSAGVRIEAAE